MCPKIDRELPNVRLPAQLSSLLPNNSKGHVAQHIQTPPSFKNNSGSGCVG